ncbi:MAG: SdrD B-like domain-containing protein [Candidatus Bathyarchaeia archaeon]
MKKILVNLLILLMLVAAAPTILRVTGDNQSQAGTTLSAEVTATAYWVIRYGWMIEKSVNPDTWHLFKGDSGTSKYTITVTKYSGTEEAWVEGVVTVTNGGERPTENLKIVIELRDGYPPPKDLIATTTVDVSSNPVLDPGETGEYHYKIAIPSNCIHADGTYKVTANVTITNHSGFLGEPFGPSPSDTTKLPSSPTLVNNVIHIDDTNGGSWEFSESGSVSYEKTFTCADEGENVNTATIRETGQSASATVIVNCYELEVRKTADTSFTRTYKWTIDKEADTSELTLKVGETAKVEYEITVDATYTDSDWKVSGTITVHNPAPIPANITSITDVVSPDINADADFGVTFPYLLPAEGTLTGTYSASLPDASSRTNTATVTIQNYAYNWDGTKTATETTDFSGTAEVDFTEATIEEVDESISVSDTYAGDLGTVKYEEAPKTFTYTRPIGPYYEPGNYEVKNTASFVTCDTEVTGSDDWTVEVHVPSVKATISGFKFYDANSNGVWDEDEPAVGGFKIELYDMDWKLLDTVFTGENGKYCFEGLDAGTYIVKEVLPSNWINTTSAELTVTLESGEVSEGNNFGNVCLKPGEGGRTLGFWTNKNGQALITLDDVTALNGLNLYKPSGWTYPPFSGTLETAKTQIRDYLLKANAKDMRWMLSAQLIATKLNVLHGFLSNSTIVYVGPSSYVPTGFIKIGEILDNANTALSGTNRAEQAYWKDLLDGLNNNRFPFVCPLSCSVEYPSGDP